MKRCRKCGVEKPHSEFYRASGTRDGFRGECKRCNLAQQHERYMSNPAAAKARVKRWQQENADRVNAYQRERRKDPQVKESAWAGHLRRKYGISVSEYNGMLARQQGVCAICEREPEPARRLHVDHDHQSNRIRGLLCFTCNNALGDFDDDPMRLREAARYLESFEPPLPAIRRRIDELKRMRPVWEGALV